MVVMIELGTEEHRIVVMIKLGIEEHRTDVMIKNGTEEHRIVVMIKLGTEEHLIVGMMKLGTEELTITNIIILPWPIPSVFLLPTIDIMMKKTIPFLAVEIPGVTSNIPTLTLPPVTLSPRRKTAVG